MSLSIGSSAARELIALPAMSILLFFWIFPITGLAGLLSYNEIQKALPWLASLIERNEKIRALVQNSLPSVAMISLNALAPFMLEGKHSGWALTSVFTCSNRLDLCGRASCSELDRVLVNEKVSTSLIPQIKT